MSTLDRIACLRTLQREWETMPDGNPQRRERWFQMVGTGIAALPGEHDQKKWVLILANTLHKRQPELLLSVCIYLIEVRVKSAQKGVAMYRQNVRIPVAASGVADECLSQSALADMDAIDTKARDDYRKADRSLFVVALVIGLPILGFSFWPAILSWMTPFKYGVVAGAVGMAALLIGLLAVGVCLGAGRLENAKR